VNFLIRISAGGVRIAAALLMSAVLAACSGGGAPTTENPLTDAPPVTDYTGPAAQNADVQAFRLNLWENIKANNRCGACHNANGQSPQFARNDDVNLAYQAANTVVNLAQPDQSRMVQKVAGGHNCWLQAASACADTLTVWVRNWAGSAATGGRQIELKEPVIKEVGASKAFPADASEGGANSFENTVYPVLRVNCSRCHAPNAGTPQQPFFASSGVGVAYRPALEEAYAAARTKMNLDTPANSRFVVRLDDESHNCWAPPPNTEANCDASAAIMLAQIQKFAGAIAPTAVDPALVTSKALTLYDGTVAAGGNRFDSNVIALYEFKTGNGNIAYDTSGVEPALNLTLSATDMWVGGWGINIKKGQKAQGSTLASKKLSDQIKASGEFSIEAWMAPADVVQEDAYAVSYSAGQMARNVTLAQRAYQYEAMIRSDKTDGNGAPSLLTAAGDRDAQASLQHVVLTYDPVNGRRIYVNGNYTGDVDPRGSGGSLADWDDTFALVLGNETSGNRPWAGVLRLVAIHNRALTMEQIQQNFAAGVGERYFLLFSVSHLIDVPKAYVMLEGTIYDNYSYLFSKPTFISLDPSATVSNVDLAGIRIGVNGLESKVGQTFSLLSTSVGGANYVKGSGQLLSVNASSGAVIASEKGASSDEFFLTFEKIGTHTHSVPEVDVPPSLSTQEDTLPDFGVRTFDELNASFARLTGVSPLTTSVVSTYANVKQQLPSVESINAFLASHQTGIAQLAIAYCAAMVDDPALRLSFFGAGANFSPDQSASFFNDSTKRAAVASAIAAKLAGTPQLLAQPTNAVVADAIDKMLEKFAINSATHPNAKGAGNAMKGACAAALGSAAVTVQ
jgi:mono/diheme cytochrome c family protein